LHGTFENWFENSRECLEETWHPNFLSDFHLRVETQKKRSLGQKREEE
jgi:hypothetical protein